MQFEEFRQRRNHARRTSTPVQNIPFDDVKTILQSQAENKKNFLIDLTGDKEGVNISYAEFYDQVMGCALFLQNHGLRSGDRIATISHNHRHTAIQYFAAWLLGLAVIPINLEDEDGNIAHTLEKGNIELAFVRTEYRNRFRKILEMYDNLKHIEWIVCEGELENFTGKKGTLTIDSTSCADSVALIIYTYGSDGDNNPGGIILTQRNLAEEAYSVARWHKITGDTRMMCVLPIHFIESIVVSLITPYLAGGTAVLGQRFQAPHFFQDILKGKADIVNLKPVQLQALNDYYEDEKESRTQYQATTLRYIICEGTSLNAETADTFEEQFNIPVISGYSRPETSSYSCFMPVGISADKRKKWRSDYGYPSIGGPISANEVAIHDLEGNALGENERGEIVVRGTNVMLKYYNNSKYSEEVFKYGWLRSGDEGFYIRDDTGRPFFFITGRIHI